MSDTVDNMVGDLISQLQDTNQQARRVPKVRDPIKKEDLENFVIQKSGALIEDTLEILEGVKDYIATAPDNRDVSSFAELVNAAASSIDSLNRMVAASKRNETMIKIKELDIASKKELYQAEGQAGITLTREEVFKMLLKNAKQADVVEAEIVTQSLPNRE
jgi:hypothetical protein